MLNVTKESIVYIFCPPNAKTGGPEALHQLCYVLNAHLNINAKMVYQLGGIVHMMGMNPAYDDYETQTATCIINNKNNIIIIPEMYVEQDIHAKDIELFNKYDKIQKAIWWLGAYRETPVGNFISHDLNLIPEASHLCQSYFAKDTLLKANIQDSYMLTDYIHESFKVEHNKHSRRNIILYNPRRENAGIIDELSADFDIEPLQGLTQDELKELFNKAKLYIDFGTHPGRDRLPREVALSNILVVASGKGASNYRDMPIPDYYRYVDNPDNLKKYIKELLNNYDTRIVEQKQYKDWILGDFTRFVDEAKEVFLHEKQ